MSMHQENETAFFRKSVFICKLCNMNERWKNVRKKTWNAINNTKSTVYAKGKANIFFRKIAVSAVFANYHDYWIELSQMAEKYTKKRCYALNLRKVICTNQLSFFRKSHFFLQKIYFRGSNFLQETKDKLFSQDKTFPACF